MSYNIHQQIFALSIGSNLLSTCKGTQSALQSQINAALQPALTNANIGDWTVVWGPTVWKAEPDNAESAPDRVWYIARNPAAHFGVDGVSYDTHVLAVAGTARGSTENFTIDGDVDKAGITTPPEQATTVEQTKLYIANGTALGISTLLTVANPTTDQTIVEFLGAA